MEAPKIFEKSKKGYRYYYVVRFNIEFNNKQEKWEYDQVDLPFGDPTYDDIVNAMISYKYPIDKMQAVVNNYLLDPDSDSNKNEFISMQEWRKYSKEYAKDIMNNF